MWPLPKIAAVYAALCFWGTASSYLIDPQSCAGDYQFVKDMVEQALSMARIAVAAVDTIPIDADASPLLQELFDIQGIAAKDLVDGAFGAGLPNNVGERRGILSFQEEITGSVESLGDAINEVVIFCDRSQLQTRIRDPFHFYDSKAKYAVSLASRCVGAFM
ncbi:hypothetical protein F4678DRAFT_460595 [Xylaria arbuscula]|nr:hypothetical protein F4678DRAFT_460595 [Xylaria arbuscula]